MSEIYELGFKQASLKVFCACEQRSEEKVPAEKIDCNR